MVLKNLKKQIIFNKGFSLAEVIIAIFVLTIGVVGGINLLTRSLSIASLSRAQIIATSLAQEGLEIVRNIRDTNWIEERHTPGTSWIEGLNCSSGCRVQYNKDYLLALGSNPVLKIGPNGFYQYDDGSSTIFRRKITIEQINDYEVKVIAEVTWTEKGQSHKIEAETRLFNWK